jgi:hypothetical protein
VRGILDGGPAIGDGSAVESIPGLDEYKPEALIASLMGDCFAPSPNAPHLEAQSDATLMTYA